MRKIRNMMICILLILLLAACGKKESALTETEQEVETQVSEPAETEQTQEEVSEPAETEQTDEQAEAQPEEENVEQQNLTDEEALAAIRNYCCINNPDLKEKEGSDEYTFYWNIESSDDAQIVVLYRSYTGALVRYYIDRTSGDTYVTEFVSGITETEERTEETFNVKDYILEGE
ncbi:MAG: hypothetical protein K6E84_03775 [Lachnospiraceae bacterium]|nr:hypothetical protein [Lachnospiraceae bacterium]